MARLVPLNHRNPLVCIYYLQLNWNLSNFIQQTFLFLWPFGSNRWPMDVRRWWRSWCVRWLWRCTACNQREWRLLASRHHVVWFGQLWWTKHSECVHLNRSFYPMDTWKFPTRVSPFPAIILSSILLVIYRRICKILIVQKQIMTKLEFPWKQTKKQTVQFPFIVDI